MPFCPQCRFEYEAEVEVCPECGAALVAALPAEESAWRELVTVYSSLEYGDVALRESLLLGSDIPTFLANEFTIYVPLLTEGFHLQVPSEYAEQALAILREAERLAEQSEVPAVSEEASSSDLDEDGEV